MRCNIDRRGKTARWISGGVVLLAGLGLLAAALLGWVSSWWLWLGAAVLIPVGVFQIYEGWCGWCVLRALGFKTPI